MEVNGQCNAATSRPAPQKQLVSAESADHGESPLYFLRSRTRVFDNRQKRGPWRRPARPRGFRPALIGRGSAPRANSSRPALIGRGSAPPRHWPTESAAADSTRRCPTDADIRSGLRHRESLFSLSGNGKVESAGFIYYDPEPRVTTDKNKQPIIGKVAIARHFCRLSDMSALRQNIYLIGDLDTQIYGNKLPSKGQVLKVLFYNIRELKLSVRDSANLVIKEVKIFWEKARLPVQQNCRCVEKLLDLHKKWSNLHKHAGKPSNIDKEKQFCSDFGNLFDIAHGDILQTIDEKRREFLESQRRDGRVGYINNMQGFFERMEAEENRRVEEIMSQRLEKPQIDAQFIGKISVIAINYYEFTTQSLDFTNIKMHI